MLSKYTRANTPYIFFAHKAFKKVELSLTLTSDYLMTYKLQVIARVRPNKPGQSPQIFPAPNTIYQKNTNFSPQQL